MDSLPHLKRQINFALIQRGIVLEVLNALGQRKIDSERYFTEDLYGKLFPHLKRQINVAFIQNGVSLELLDASKQKIDSERYFTEDLYGKLFPKSAELSEAKTTYWQGIGATNELKNNLKYVLLAPLVIVLINFSGISVYSAMPSFLLAIMTVIYTTSLTVEKSSKTELLGKYLNKDIISSGVVEYSESLVLVEAIEVWLKMYGNNPAFSERAMVLKEARTILFSYLEGNGPIMNEQIAQNYPLDQIRLQIGAVLNGDRIAQNILQAGDELLIESAAAHEAEAAALEDHLEREFGQLAASLEESDKK